MPGSEVVEHLGGDFEALGFEVLSRMVVEFALLLCEPGLELSVHHWVVPG